MGKKPLKSKTIWLGLLTSVVSVVGAKVPQIAVFLTDNWSWVGGVLGAVIIVLRGLTGRPLELSGS